MNHFKMGDPIPIKNKNVLIFSLYYKEQHQEYLPMTYYSLKTLLKQEGKKNFDIIVFYSLEEDKDLLNYIFWKDFNLIKDFPQVTFIKTKYSENYNDGYMSKWYHIEKAFEYEYETVLYVDTDVIFLENPNTIFDYCKDKTFSTYENGYVKRNEVVLKKSGILSAVVSVPKKDFIKIPNFFDKVVQKRILLKDMGKQAYEEKKLTEKEYLDYCFFSEQYAGQHVFLDYNITVHNLGYDWKKVILHYSHNFCFEYLPEELQTDYVKLVEKSFNKEE